LSNKVLANGKIGFGVTAVMTMYRVIGMVFIKLRLFLNGNLVLAINLIAIPDEMR
jgi:hypothetical protein